MVLLLRDITSLLSRVKQFKAEDLEVLEQKCRQYFNAASIFVTVNPSVWTLGYVAPVHAKNVFSRFSVGIGINTMQGREAKNQKLKEYSENSRAVIKGRNP